jgi:hypothetical protein
MRSTTDNKEWSLIHNENGEWISEGYVMFISKTEARILQKGALKQGYNLSIQHGPDGSLWCYKHEYVIILKLCNYGQKQE